MSKKTVTKKDLEKLAKLGNVLTDKDLKKLEKLGVKIRACLSCNINDTGVPCRTDRLEAVRLMQEYLLVHDIPTAQKRCIGSNLDQWVIHSR